MRTGGERLGGEPKAWKLTPLGGEVAQRVSTIATPAAWPTAKT
jgi:hypothetical protein